MALDKNILGRQLYTALTSTDPSKTQDICNNIAQVIIEHIQQYGDVNVTVQTSSGSGTGTGKMS